MYEIGDDMLVLGSQKDRLALVENRDLLNMAKLSRASTPVDLMSYDPDDEQPSIFFLRESPHQSILTIFNWTKNPRSHTLKLVDLGLPATHAFAALDVLNLNAPLAVVDGTVQIANQLPESVKVIKIFDRNLAPSAPKVTAKVPSAANAGETISFSAQAEATGVPAIEYRWEFGDGVSASGPSVSHAYTRAGNFTLSLTVDGIDVVPTVQVFSIKVTGSLRALPSLLDNRRFREPTDR
jgi:alpha-galactosidase